MLVAVLALGGMARAHPGHPHPAPEVDEFESEAAISMTGHDVISGLWYAGLAAAGALTALALCKRRNDLFPG